MRINFHNLWEQYELIDCGNDRKLERFGNYILIRPEITAKNAPALPNNKWTEMADAEFIETGKTLGIWTMLKDIPKSWNMEYENAPISIKAELALTNSKHIGAFPEQVLNWTFLKNKIKTNENLQILNLFAYTGLSSIVSSFFADKVTHVDSIKKVVSWAKKNMELSEKDNIRFIVDDAPKFVYREIKRNNKYGGIILDPPPIGMGANNEKWILEEMLEDLLLNISKITESRAFIIMNLYSHSISEKYIHKIILTYFPEYNIDICEKIFGLSRFGNTIDHGYFVRILKNN
jgi:23S rRNA (cytosine1962-C5)-methyltransferase